MNKAILIGRLGADAEIRTMPNGNLVANARIATDERWKDAEGNAQKRTEWHRLVAFGKLAEVFQSYCKKGRRISIIGRIQTREWVDENKIKRYTTEIVVSEIEFLDSNGAAQPAEPTPPTPDEDVPF
jgi:single-strand DNA-binding protein